MTSNILYKPIMKCVKTKNYKVIGVS